MERMNLPKCDSECSAASSRSMRLVSGTNTVHSRPARRAGTFLGALPHGPRPTLSETHYCTPAQRLHGRTGLRSTRDRQTQARP
jgi:hypothetical protein